MADLYFVNDRKTWANKAIFQHTISKANDLRENGLTIYVNKRKVKIYFITSLVLGNNLGLNEILSFVESFQSSMFCTMCYAPQAAFQTMIKPKSLS